MALNILNGQVLVGSTFEAVAVTVHEGTIGLDAPATSGLTIDASGLMVLPGIVDIHGDAFERQIEPRPGVRFPLPLALQETDRQLVANGITTACHAVTCSWEPGLRSMETAARLIDGLDDARGQLAADNRFHLRHEIFNLDGEAQVLEWIAGGKLTALAFNDHMDDITRQVERKSSKLGRMIERTGLDREAYLALVERTINRAGEVPANIARIAEAARIAGLPILSHDDRHLEDRFLYRGLGSRIAEFPKVVDVAREAIAAHEHVVFGAPNIVRGGSQNSGSPAAGEMVARGLCTILASDYFYPALRQAVFTLAKDRTMTLAAAWALVSAHPAEALGLADRGTIRAGLRGDLALVRMAERGLDIVATIADGRVVHLTEPHRILAQAGVANAARRVA